MTPLRVGFIGCGKIARKHAAATKTIPMVEVAGLYDHTLQNAETFARELGTGRAFDDLIAMLDVVKPDLVFICLPPFAHTSEVARVCERGIHFLIEKPIALDLTQAQEMVRVAEASRVKTQVGFMFRHGAAVRWLKDYLATRPSAAFMTARYACNSLHRPWWRERATSGGQLVEQIIHLLDLTRYLLGKPVSIFSMQDNLFHRAVPDYTVEDASGTLIRFANGSIAVVAANNGAIPGRWDSDWRVVHQNLTADFADANHAALYDTQSVPPALTQLESDDNLFRLQALDLIDAIRNDGVTRAPIQEGLASLTLALAAVDSAAQNVPLTVSL